jgi:hypothetical protein
VRWTGQVEPLYSETYTFYTVSDDGVRLWVDGQLLVDNWNNHSAHEDNGTIDLAAGQQYDLRMEYYENGGDAVARLLWSSPTQAKEVIPQNHLYSPATTPPPVGTGNGLLGRYFDEKDFTGLALMRTDAIIDFDWARNTPDGALGKDTFSIRWTGQVEPQYSETYTFYTLSDDGGYSR